MISIGKIKELFKTGDYSTAIVVIKKALGEQPMNSQLHYYLFLAENQDFINMDFDNILHYEHYQLAYNLADDKLKLEYKRVICFFKALSKGFRKLFGYAYRERSNLFVYALKNFNLEEEYLRLDELEEDEFNEYLKKVIELRNTKEDILMNLLSINLLYLSTKNEKLKTIHKELLDKALDFGFSYEGFEFFNDEALIKEYASTNLKESLKKDNPNKTYKVPSPTFLCPCGSGMLYMDCHGRIGCNGTDDVVMAYNKKLEERDKKFDRFARTGLFLSLGGIITSILVFGVAFNIPGIVFGSLGTNSRNAKKNGSIAAIIIGIFGIVLNFIMIFVWYHILYNILVSKFS